MRKAVDVSQAPWEVHAQDDPEFVRCAERLTAAAAALGEQRRMHVVRVDNWFGARWFRYYRRDRRGPVRDSDAVTHALPPFHPRRVLSEQCYELDEAGVLHGPFEPSQMLHRPWRGADDPARERRIARGCEPGVYAWCSGNTLASDRAALMAYTYVPGGAAAWYVEFRRTDAWRLSRRVDLGDADWRRLHEVGGVGERQPHSASL